MLSTRKRVLAAITSIMATVAVTTITSVPQAGAVQSEMSTADLSTQAVRQNIADTSADNCDLVTNIRAERRDGFDRVIFTVDGPGFDALAWDAEYITAPADDSGSPIEVSGDKILWFRISGTDLPINCGVPEFPRGPVAYDQTNTVVEANYQGWHEGYSTAYIGIAGRERKYNVTTLPDQRQILLDIDHADGQGTGVHGLAYDDARNGDYYDPETLPNKDVIDNILSELGAFDSYIDESTGAFNYAGARANVRISLHALVPFAEEFRSNGGLLTSAGSLAADRNTVDAEIRTLNEQLWELANRTVSAGPFSTMEATSYPDCGADLTGSWNEELQCSNQYDVYSGARPVLRGEELYQWVDRDAAVIYGATFLLNGGLIYTHYNSDYPAGAEDNPYTKWTADLGSRIDAYTRQHSDAFSSSFGYSRYTSKPGEPGGRHEGIGCAYHSFEIRPDPLPGFPTCLSHTMDGSEAIHVNLDGENSWNRDLFPTVESRIELLKEIFGVADIERCLELQFSSCAWVAVGIIPIGRAVSPLLREAAEAALKKVIAASKGTTDGLRASRIRSGEIPPDCNKACTLPMPDEFAELALRNVTNSGETVLGKHPLYLDVAKDRGASYFDVGDRWADMEDYFPDKDPWPVNAHFLDDRIAARDTFTLALPDGVTVERVKAGSSYLAREFAYLEAHGYELVDDLTYKPKM